MRRPTDKARGPVAPAVSLSGTGERLALQGDLALPTLPSFQRALARQRRTTPDAAARELDLARLRHLDTPGALLLCRLRDEGLRLVGLRPEHAGLLELVGGLDVQPLPRPPRTARWREIVIQIGRGADEAVRGSLALVRFLGQTAGEAAGMLRHPRRIPLASITRQIADTGLSALPIIGAMAVMIAVVIGYQGVAQLRPIGGEEYTIALIAVSVLREMGVLITAIMVAGRSGSAFAAELGVMKARDELAALQVMGLEPVRLLVVPRIAGLAITLPLLTFYADLMGLAGGALISAVLLQVSPAQYLLRVQQAADVNDLLVGLLKAPVFAVIIAVIGCQHGLRVHGSAESVGRETTRAVVQAIFLVIVLDALFSVLFEELGL